MTDDTREKIQNRRQSTKSSNLSRREFVAMSVATGLTAAARMTSAAGLDVVESDVEVKTPDGICDAVFIHPRTGTHPGVLIWADSFGLRPAIRGIGRRMATEGYSVLVPNTYYRTAKAPLFSPESVANHTHNHETGQALFANKDEMAMQDKALAALNAPGAGTRDSIAYLAFLDAQKQVDKTKKIGTHGYCIGGRMVVYTAAAVPDRVAAGGSFHPGLSHMVTNEPNSPHLLAPQIKAHMYFALASDDDKDFPDVKVKIRQAFAAAKVPTELEVYPDLHGWCLPDYTDAYNKPDAERAWSKLLSLYKDTLG
jgi:carboxymethylenebutenolidase